MIKFAINKDPLDQVNMLSTDWTGAAQSTAFWLAICTRLSLSVTALWRSKWSLYGWFDVTGNTRALHFCGDSMRFVGEVVIILRYIGDDAQSVRHAHGNHVFWIQQGWNTQLTLSNLKRQTVVLKDIFFWEGIKIYEIRSVSVDDGTEGQSISEGWSHVCNVHITVTFTLVPAPVLQSFQRAHGRDSKIHTYSLVLLLQYTRRPKSSWETLFHMSLSGTVRSCCLNFKRSHSTKVSSTDLTVDYFKEEDKKNQHTRVKLQLQLKA